MIVFVLDNLELIVKVVVVFGFVVVVLVVDVKCLYWLKFYYGFNKYFLDDVDVVMFC